MNKEDLKKWLSKYKVTIRNSSMEVVDPYTINTDRLKSITSELSLTEVIQSEISS